MARTDYSKFTDTYINNLSEADLRKYIRKTSDAINKRLSRENNIPEGTTNLEKLYKLIGEGSDFALKYRNAAQSGIQEAFVKPVVGKVRKLRTSVKNVKDIDKLRDILRQNLKILNTKTFKQHFKSVVKDSGMTIDEFSKLDPELFKDKKAAKIAREHYYDDLTSMDGEKLIEESETTKDLGYKMANGDINAAKELLKRGLISLDEYLTMMRKLE